MTDLLAKLRAQDDYREFYEIATRIRNQKLLSDSEKESLGHHVKEVAESEIKLLTESWQSSYWRIVFRQLKSQSDPLDPTVVCHLLRVISETTAQPSYRVFGHHYSKVDQVLTILYNEPSTVAAILNNIDQNDVNFNDSAIQILFHMLYSCGMYPEDELRFSQIVCELLKKQLLKSNDKMRMMLRKETSISTRFYKLFVESSHPTMVYLTRALRKGVLAVVQLGNFWLDIDEKQSSTRFLRDNHQDKARLPEYRAMVVSKLVELVDVFLEEIHKALPILPSSLSWIIRNIFCSLYEVFDDVSAIELSHACKDMVVSNLLCPAIISPQKFGVIDNDVRIGTIVNHNLTQVAMILQMVSLREFEKPPIEYEEFLMQCRKTNLISDMMDVLLMEKEAPEVEIISIINSGAVKSDRMTKSSFVGSVGDVNTLVKLIRDSSNAEDPILRRVRQICNKMPSVFSSSAGQANLESGDNSPRLTFKNIHKKLHQSLTLKRTESPNTEAEVRNLGHFESAYFDKDNFELFYLDYQPETYSECPPIDENTTAVDSDSHDNLTTPENLPTPDNISPAPSSEPEQTVDEVAESEAPVDLLSGDPPKVEMDHIEVPEKRAESISPDQSADNPRTGFAKLKSLGGLVKRGIAQSSTLSDIRGHLRRSTSIARNDTSIPTSASENDLSEVASSAPSGPRDDILAKYASKSSKKDTTSPFPSLIDFNNKVADKEVVEPYYSAENLTSCRAFKDTLRKLTTVLGSVSYLPTINCRAHRGEGGQVNKKIILDRFLGGLLVEAEHKMEYGLAAQLREVKRCIELFETSGVLVLIDHLKTEEINREAEIADLREKRAVLMRKSNDIGSLEGRVQLSQKLSEQLIVDSLMRTFIENGFTNARTVTTKTPEVAAVLKFYDEFKFLQAQDERAEFLRNLLTFLKERLVQNQDWNYATESMLARAMTTVERFVMFAVYETAFHPNSGADQHRDKVLRANIARIATDITPDFLDVPPRLHGEAPWPSAQAELSMLDIYVTAQDKLKCINRCCEIINNLIALSSKNAVASADDAVSVLVFVLVKANPRSLLSNVQFVETFAGERTNGGNESYCWTNFKGAIEHVKTFI